MTTPCFLMRCTVAAPARATGRGLVTILTIALGVGAVTTLFSVAYGVLLRPLPWGATERLVRLSETRGGREGRVPGTMMNGSYIAWADAPQTLEGIGYYSGDTQMTLTGAGEATRIAVSRVTPSTIQLLGVPAIRGRIFEATDGGSRTTNRPWCLSHTACGNNASAGATTSSGNRSCLTACNTRLSA